MKYFLFVGIVLWVLGMVTEVFIIYYLAYFVIFLYLILCGYKYYLKNYLELNHKVLDDHVFFNEKSKCRIEIINQGIIPIIWLKVIEKLPTELQPGYKKNIFYLRPREKRTWEFEIRGRKRGYYKPGPLRWKAGEVFGFFTVSKRIGKSNPFIVYPRIFTQEKIEVPSQIPLGEIKWLQPIYKDMAKMAGVREHYSGDNFKHIHWKATARNNELMVKEFESTVSLEVAIILNLNENDYGVTGSHSKIEMVISVAASVAHYLNRISQPFQLVTNGKATGITVGSDLDIMVPVGHGESHLQRVLEVLARVKPTSEKNFLSLFKRKFNLSPGSTMIVITEKDNEPLIQEAYMLVKNGFRVKLLVLGKVLHKQYLNLPLTSSLTIFRVREKNDIK